MGKAFTRIQLAIIVSILVVAAVASLAVYNIYIGSKTSEQQKPSAGSGGGNSTTYSGTIIGNFQAPNVLVAHDVNPNYTFTVTSIGSVPSSVQLKVMTPPGIFINFNPSNVTITPDQTSMLNAEVTVSSSVSPGIYSFEVKFVNGGFEKSENLSLDVVEYLVITVGTSFIPKNITVPVGSTVVWYRLNGALSQYDSGIHNVVFTNGMASSPPLMQYQSWSFQFNQIGIYYYECTYHLPFMVGVVNVSR